MQNIKLHTSNPYSPVSEPNAYDWAQSLIDAHQVTAGYCEGGYDAQCSCGWVGDDTRGDLDHATIDGTGHLMDTGAMRDAETIISLAAEYDMQPDELAAFTSLCVGPSDPLNASVAMFVRDLLNHGKDGDHS